ncbi:hypothetical protein E3983_10450 [Legionella israelensis]|uniref:Thiaminase-2/PQQC domain-containing protein n=1 Tax=Legionella israelensis TaxID=454 RepID=A0AAX1EI79_9GAMM|nr:hypothetical protein [Legionella israelensis]QBR84739.1 hypothetical protein E3983_10450 [Legionella israelensis]
MLNRFFIFLLLLLPLISFAQEETFFSKALKQNHAVLNKILSLPFNRKLNQGSLKLSIFNAFLAQDAYYLSVYDRLAQGLYQRLPKSQKSLFTLTQSLDYEIKINNEQPTKLTPANKAYTKFLIDTAEKKSNAVLIAAMLPCQWLYQRVYNVTPNKTAIQYNPYQYWPKTYQNQSYQQTTKQFIQLANQTYANSNQETKEAMMNAFKQAMNFEYQFWSDAYALKYR